MPEFYVEKMTGRLQPIDDAGREALQAIPNGAIVKVKTSIPRNEKHHRKFFKLLSVVAENSPVYDSVDQLLVAMKIATGHVKTLIVPRFSANELAPVISAFHELKENLSQQASDKVHHLVELMESRLKEAVAEETQVVYVPKSIAFHNMDQVEFSKFFNRCVEIVCRRFLPGVKDTQLRKQVEDLVADRRYESKVVSGGQR